MIIAQAERETAMNEVGITDIVLYHDSDVGRQIPAMIVKLESQERVWLNVFTIDWEYGLGHAQTVWRSAGTAGASSSWLETAAGMA